MKLLKYQLWHFVSLLILLGLIYMYFKQDQLNLSGQLFGIRSSTWFIIALLSPILHQIYVMIFWRLELFYKSVSGWFGDKGFLFFKIGFAVLILSRLVTICLLAYSDPNTLYVNPIFANISAFIIFIPSAYLFYSVKKYFGMNRAFGIDHFDPDEMKNKPFVKKGIFKYTSNGMYIYGFLILYIPGLLMLSKAALVAALFNHVYIWVHYYFTELPDIKVIYKE